MPYLRAACRCLSNVPCSLYVTFFQVQRVPSFHTVRFSSSPLLPLASLYNPIFEHGIDVIFILLDVHGPTYVGYDIMNQIRSLGNI